MHVLGFAVIRVIAKIFTWEVAVTACEQRLDAVFPSRNTKN